VVLLGFVVFLGFMLIAGAVANAKQ
jgi:hypothetical protein